MLCAACSRGPAAPSTNMETLWLFLVFAQGACVHMWVGMLSNHNQGGGYTLRSVMSTGSIEYGGLCWNRTHEEALCSCNNYSKCKACGL